MRTRADGAIVAVIVCAVLAVVGAVWLTFGLEGDLTRHAADRQAAGTRLLTSMLDQETGARGYLIAGGPQFLEPYLAGRDAFTRAVRDSRGLADGDARTLRDLHAVVAKARAWQALAVAAIAHAKRTGPGNRDVQAALTRKRAMDSFRGAQRHYADLLAERQRADLSAARRDAVLLVLTLVLLFCAAGAAVVRWVRRMRASEEWRYRQLVRSLPDSGALTFDSDLRFTSVDGAALDALGWTNEEIVGKRLADLVAPEQLTDLELRYRRALAGETDRFEINSATTKASWAIETTPLRGDDDKVVGGLIMMRNITERRAAEREAERRTRDVEALGDAARELARASDASDVYREMLEAAARIASPAAAAVYTPSGQGHVACRRALGDAEDEPPAVLEAHRHVANRVLRTGTPVMVANPLADGGHGISAQSNWPCSIGFLPICGESAPVGVLALAWNERMATLSERLETTLGLLCHEAAAALDRVSLLERLDTLARTDPLTGLSNRRVWDEQLTAEISRARREERPLMVAMLDLDRFKRFNDSRGHAAGDRMLRSLAAALSAQLRDTDTLARLGGEEFGVLAPGCDAGQAERLLARLRSVVPEGQTCSAGFAIWDRQEDDDGVVKRADDALYEAKRTGRDRTCASSAAGVAPPA